MKHTSTTPNLGFNPKASYLPVALWSAFITAHRPHCSKQAQFRLPQSEVEAIRAAREAKAARREINNIRAAALNSAWK